jgi:hypothetical protein
MSNNPPEVVIHLTREQAEFLLKNCDANLTLSIGLLDGVSDRSIAERIVKVVEAFKTIKEATKRGLE